MWERLLCIEGILFGPDKNYLRRERLRAVRGWWQSRAGGPEAIPERTLPVYYPIHTVTYTALLKAHSGSREATWVRSLSATASEPVSKYTPGVCCCW